MAGGHEPKRWRWRDQLPPVRAARVTRLRRWALQRAGARDGRAGRPKFTEALPGVTTAFRVGIEREMLAQIESVKHIYAKLTAELDRTYQEAQKRVESIREQLAEKRRQLAEAERRRPDPNLPAPRRRGEWRQSEHIVRARRQREFDQLVAEPLRRTIAALAAEEEAQIARRDLAAARIAALDLERRRVEQWIASMQFHARSIYDQALLRRHPFGDHIRPLLDGGTLEMPAWPLPDWLQRPPSTEEVAR